MDQAASLRKLVNKKEKSQKIDMFAVVSGKGGVGKTTLVSDLYNQINNAYIIDCDINSPYFWRYASQYNYQDGFKVINGQKMLKKIEEVPYSEQYVALVDCGTGQNEINQYYLKKASVIIFVTSVEEISLLNTINMIKDTTGTKMLYIPNETKESIIELQQRISLYSKLYLNSEYICVTSDVKKILKMLDNCRR